MNLASRLKPAPGKERIGDGAQQGIEVVGTIIVAFLIGWGLDTWLGTTPLFMIALTLVAAVGKVVVVFATYSAKMRVLEAERRSTTTYREADARAGAVQGRSEVPPA